jgi:allantoinase
MRARVAATWLRGRLVWDGSHVLAKPGDGQFVRRQAM